ncbi:MULTISPECIES: hypothetical protein [unclassified Gordonia (in: high G+C Gram-positive bacteria)]|uniref:hypothetical protein n=1 Tax=unclassified Gordonia (in: high G+C Gram-positive bacteria) TaxID=2657482 RepID=UPI0009AE6A3F|nr:MULTISPECIES: hypothetical protein [unclassified Gordonia (in: high G+C Gram-positive bacteria)]MDF3282306.1 hypothetical protein [Gordonia sp. N1V]OPX14014.1 hypothetical protein B1964_17240 [Gordonia sp. i37]
MGKRSRGKKKDPKRRHLQPVRSAKGGGRGGRPMPGADEQPLIQSIRLALRTGEPIDMLVTLSTLLEATDPEPHPLADREDRATRDTLIESFVEISFAETTAALTVFRELLADELQADELLAARITRTLAGRRQPMPAWLGTFGEARVVSEVYVVGDELSDGESYIFTIGWPPEHELSFLVYVDHNMGSIVKDAFVVPAPVEDLLAHFRESASSAMTTVVCDPVDAGTARATLEEAMKIGRMTFPPAESDSWPMCRPLVEWALRLLPEAGAAPSPREWTDAEYSELADAFFASPHGRPLDDAEHRSALEPLMWMAAPDPMRWSPVVVEIMLLDRIPRKIIDDVESLQRYPELMRRFVRYCHGERGISRAATTDTLAAIDECEAEFREEIRRDRPSNAVLLAQLARASALGQDASILDGLSDYPPGFDSSGSSLEEFILRELDKRVGGRPTLLSLDAEPLPDEQFDVTGIAEDILPVVEVIRQRCDASAEVFFDVEHRTAMRRLLGRAARRDPAIFRRKASTDRAAAAIGWIIGRANDTLGGDLLTTTVAEFLDWFGVKGSVSQRAEPFLRANGVNPHDSGHMMALGTPTLLTSQMRASIIKRRDDMLAGM